MATTHAAAVAAHAAAKVAQLDREIAAHGAEIKRLKGKKATFAKLAKKAPAEPQSAASTDQTTGAAD